MSLISALNIGKTALSAQQAAIQVTSNNIANASDANYARQVAKLSPGIDVGTQAGISMGTGVYLDSISRQVDNALDERIRASTSDGQAAGLKQQQLDQVESVFNALGDNDLSSQLSTFFNSWSSLANNPLDQGLRQVVLQTGDTLASTFNSVSTQLTSIAGAADKQLSGLVSQANQLVDQIAKLNQQISTAQAGTGQGANALCDQRDAALSDLSQLVDIKVQDTGNGMVNVMVGSEPIVLQGTSRGLKLSTTQVNGQTQTTLSTVANGADLATASGQIGALLSLKGDTSVTDQLNNLASNLIFELNKLHSSGQGSQWLTTTTASNKVADPTAALNTAGAALPFTPTTGSFIVQVRQKSTGLVTSQLVNVDLDGKNGDDTTLTSLATDLSTVPGLNASVAGGKLKIAAQSSDYEFSFSQDTSGALAALGVNSFFTGTNAGNIAVSADLKSQPALLAAAANGDQGDNTNAQAIAQLGSKTLSGLNGLSLSDSYGSLVTSVGSASSNAKTAQQAAQAVSDTLTSQRASLSGVSLDEEATNLIQEQRAYQAAARVISTVDQMMQALLQIT
ncbi:MAG: flagellar hook-associated protein FlgK [Tepidisphaeraceae bacterium]|jgi:flagellar hook-associated protein 1 FlgK